MVHESAWPPAKPKTLLLRLKPALHRALVRWAKEEMRSVHAQVEFALRKALSESAKAKR
ncbi:MAG TPA: hypothetical protein VK661_10410 [Planctomycetota bacterium]|jgi:hypothetical protein|nr:hypothetical protein [Planctomycetota bacterium]